MSYSIYYDKIIHNNINDLTTLEEKMIKGIYSLFDKKSKLYMNTFTSINDGTAIREMQQAVTQEGSIIQKYPQDYALFKISEWDDESGMLQNQDRQQVIEIDQLIAKENTDV